ncbi:hypothetical protein JCM16303_001371 [Sporobolomyces ruberrimus]
MPKDLKVVTAAVHRKTFRPATILFDPQAPPVPSVPRMYQPDGSATSMIQVNHHTNKSATNLSDAEDERDWVPVQASLRGSTEQLSKEPKPRSVSSIPNLREDHKRCSTRSYSLFPKHDPKKPGNQAGISPQGDTDTKEEKPDQTGGEFVVLKRSADTGPTTASGKKSILPRWLRK